MHNVFFLKRLRTNNVHNDSARTVHCAGHLCNNIVPHNGCEMYHHAEKIENKKLISECFLELTVAREACQRSPTHNARTLCAALATKQPRNYSPRTVHCAQLPWLPLSGSLALSFSRWAGGGGVGKRPRTMRTILRTTDFDHRLGTACQS